MLAARTGRSQNRHVSSPAGIVTVGVTRTSPAPATVRHTGSKTRTNSSTPLSSVVMPEVDGLSIS